MQKPDNDEFGVVLTLAFMAACGLVMLCFIIAIYGPKVLALFH